MSDFYNYKERIYSKLQSQRPQVLKYATLFLVMRLRTLLQRRNRKHSSKKVLLTYSNDQFTSPSKTIYYIVNDIRLYREAHKLESKGKRCSQLKNVTKRLISNAFANSSSLCWLLSRFLYMVSYIR